MKKTPTKTQHPDGSPTEIVSVTPKADRVDWATILAGIAVGKTVFEFSGNRKIFIQGEPADSLFFLLRGKVKLSVTCEGKEAIIATLGSGDFCGEGCLGGESLRTATAISVGDCSMIMVEKPIMEQMLHEERDLAAAFLAQLLSRIVRYEADLVDQFFNSSEKRLARLLLLLSHFDEDSGSETVVPGINQENLAQMVGTTRSRVSYFMNKFRKLGFIDYGDHNDSLVVHRGLLSVVHPDRQLDAVA